MQRLKKIGVLSLAYTLAAIYLIIGLVIGILMRIGLSIPEIAARMGPDVIQLGNMVLLLFPVTYLLTGFISGIFISLLYNLISRRTGGVKIEISDSKKKK